MPCCYLSFHRTTPLMSTSLLYNIDLQRAIQIGQAFAKERNHDKLHAPHVLLGLLHNEVGLASQLAVWGFDVSFLREWAEIRTEALPRSMGSMPDPPASAEVKKLFDIADAERLKLGEDILSPLAVLAALCKPGVVFSKDQLKSFALTEGALLEAYLQNAQATAAISADAGSESSSNGHAASSSVPAQQQAIHAYCIDKTAMAREERIDPIVGRDEEIRVMAEIMGRRSKPNVLLTGEPGVGKTALVDGFALRVVAGDVPEHLQEATLLELDLGALVAGAAYKGEVEDRLKKILKALKHIERPVLFIDEIHLLLDPQAATGSGIANLLKPELARGELTVIGATTRDEYRMFLEPDEAFCRRFERLDVEEPNASRATRMLKALLPRYEEHHQLEVQATTLPETVRLASRYIKDRSLPDAAIDLMDRTMAVIRLARETSTEEIEKFTNEIAEIESLPEEEQLAEYQWLHDRINSSFSPVLLGQWDNQDEVPEETLALKTYLQNKLSALASYAEALTDHVRPKDVAAVIANKTGIPMGKIQTKEREKLLRIEEVLRERVVGQDHALETMSEAIRINRAGLGKPGLPIGSFFLLGPTGTGKTELAKTLATFLFNDEKALIRFDMSEFKEEHSAALLYGAPPGYVGYKEGGLLVNKIRQQPYAVVLFDEIEKAHPSVFDIFLQILDEGKLHDKLGKEGDFANAIVLFTSNIGSEFVVNAFEEGDEPDDAKLREIMGNYFRPEFLGRLTGIVPFRPISEAVAERIFDIHCSKLLATLERQGVQLELSSAARKHLAYEGFNPTFGARPLLGVIRNRLQRPISRMLISGELAPGSTLKLDVDEGTLQWSQENESQPTNQL